MKHAEPESVNLADERAAAAMAECDEDKSTGRPCHSACIGEPLAVSKQGLACRSAACAAMDVGP